MIGARIGGPRRWRPRSASRRPALRPIPRARARVITVAVAAALLAAAGLWLRDSPVVAVEHVQVKGAGGPDGPAIRSALSRAARDMTTLHVREGSLRDAVASYPVVKDLRVSAHPLHGLSIQVVEYAPAAALEAGGRRVAVAADGTILRKARLDGLPLVPAHALPSGDHLRDRQAVGAVALASAAPAGLRALITRIRSGGQDGLRADLQGGLRIIFGSRERLVAKWEAAARVLADPKAAGAAYLDVRVADRPVAGSFTDLAGTPTPGQVVQSGAGAGQQPTPAAAGSSPDRGAAADPSATGDGTGTGSTATPPEAQPNP